MKDDTQGPLVIQRTGMIMFIAYADLPDNVKHYINTDTYLNLELFGIDGYSFKKFSNAVDWLVKYVNEHRFV